MCRPIIGPSAGDTNTEYEREGDIDMKKACLLHTYTHTHTYAYERQASLIFIFPASVHCVLLSPDVGPLMDRNV